MLRFDKWKNSSFILSFLKIEYFKLVSSFPKSKHGWPISEKLLFKLLAATEHLPIFRMRD